MIVKTYQLRIKKYLRYPLLRIIYMVGRKDEPFYEKVTVTS